MSADPHIVTREQVLEALRSVEDPELHKSIVDLDMVRDIQVGDGRDSVNALLTISACRLRETIVNSIRERVRTIPGVREVDVTLGEMAPNERQALTTFINEVHWGDDMDYLLLDLPPGTGDVSITIAQTLPQTHMVIVTTPQAAAVSVAQRAARMAEKVNIEVLGIIENMSYYRAAPDQPPVYIFGRGGGQRLAEVQSVPLLGEIPLDPAVREGGDEGVPVILSAPESPAAKAFRATAERLVKRLPIPVA